MRIEISNKGVYTLITLSIFLILTVSVVAYNVATTPANPSKMGHTIDEIEIINADGTTTSLEQYIESKISGVGETTCSSTSIYESGVSFKDESGKYDAGKKTVPAACKSDAGCIIKQEIYDSKGLKLVRQYQFSQTPDASSKEKWWSSHKTSGTYTNGDTTSTDIIPSYGGDTSYLRLRDDYSSSSDSKTQETSDNEFVFIDRSGSYGMKVYICSESGSGAE